MVLAYNNLFDIVGNTFNGLYQAFNVKIPGFPISISDIAIGLFILSVFVAIFKMGKGSDN